VREVTGRCGSIRLLSFYNIYTHCDFSMMLMSVPKNFLVKGSNSSSMEDLLIKWEGL